MVKQILKSQIKKNFGFKCTKESQKQNFFKIINKDLKFAKFKKCCFIAKKKIILFAQNIKKYFKINFLKSKQTRKFYEKSNLNINLLHKIILHFNDKIKIISKISFLIVNEKIESFKNQPY